MPYAQLLMLALSCFMFGFNVNTELTSLAVTDDEAATRTVARRLFGRFGVFVGTQALLFWGGFYDCFFYAILRAMGAC